MKTIRKMTLLQNIVITKKLDKTMSHEMLTLKKIYKLLTLELSVCICEICKRNAFYVHIRSL